MTVEEAGAKYQSMGLKTKYIVDTPNEISKPHRHSGVYLYTVKGSVRVKLDNKDWQTILPGQEIRIEDNQLHEAITSTEGWEYLFASSPEEFKRQGLD